MQDSIKEIALRAFALGWISGRNGDKSDDGKLQVMNDKIITDTTAGLTPSGDCPNCGASPDVRELADSHEYPEYAKEIHYTKCVCKAVIKETYTLTKVKVIRVDKN